MKAFELPKLTQRQALALSWLQLVSMLLSGCESKCRPGLIRSGALCVPPMDATRPDSGAFPSGSAEAAMTRKSAVTERDATVADASETPSRADRADAGLSSRGQDGTGQPNPAGGSGGTNPDAGLMGAMDSPAAGPAGAACNAACCDDSECPTGGACKQGKCSCPEGQHTCGSACVDSRSVNTCGTACEPCLSPRGGTATCDGAQCGSACPTGTRICAGECIGEASPCGNDCPTGTHNCANNCVPESNVTACGSSCMPCKVPTHGAATCDANACGFTCDPSYRKCDSSCIEVTGACCTTTDCNARNHEQCDTTSHRCECARGYKECNGECIAEDACCSSSDCSSGKICSGVNHTCECGSSAKECNGRCVAGDSCCPGVDNGNACRAGFVAGVCDGTGQCVQCVSDRNCTNRDTPHCDTSRGECVQCIRARDCPDGGDYAECKDGMCTVKQGCGNGRLDPNEECDIGATGTPNTGKWTASTCTAQCESLIYVYGGGGSTGCSSPRAKSQTNICTVYCGSTSDCPALGLSYPNPICNQMLGTCEIPCQNNNQCLTRSGVACIELAGLPNKPKYCANPL